MRKILIRNSLSGVFQSVINIALVFTVIPVFIKILGNEEYAVFSLIIVVGNLNVFTNLGLNRALVKFIAEQGKVQESNYDIIITFLLTTFILLPFTFSLIIFNNFIINNILKIPIIYYTDAKVFYILIVISNYMIISGQVAKAVLDSGQKIVITNTLQVIYNLIYWGLILLLLLLGYNLRYLGIAALLSSLIWFIAITYISIKYWGKISLTGLFKNFKRVSKKQLIYGSKIYLGGMLGFLYIPFTKILISNYIGLNEVAFFDISIRIKNQLWGVIAKIYYPLYPLIAGLKNKNKIRLIVHDIEQKTLYFIAPIAIIISFTTFPFIQLWIGKNVEIISIGTIFIVCSFLISISVIPNYQFLIAKGHADKNILLQISNVFFNALIFFSLYKFLGYYAAIAGNVIAILSSFILSLYYQKKYLNSLIFDNIKQIVKLFFLLLINIFFGYSINRIFTSDWVKIISIPIILGIVSLAAFRFLKIFNKEDILRYSGSNLFLYNLGVKILIPTKFL